MRLDTSGNVGIGTSSPSSFGKLAVTASSGVIGNFESTQSATNANLLNLNATQTNSSAGIRFQINSGTTAQARIQLNGDGAIVFQQTSSDTERVRIDTSGNLLVGTTTPAQTLSTNNVLTLKAPGISNVWGVGPTSSYGTFYVSTSGTGVSLAGGATSWGAVSDERHKDIIEPITDAANKVASLRAVIGKYKTDELGTRRSFLIAQDVQAVLPEAVDNTDSENLALRYSEVTPLLVAAIQEQQAMIQTLTARIEALEAA